MRIKTAFFAGLLCILAAGFMALPESAEAQTQCFMCTYMYDGLWHSDGGCGGSSARQDTPDDIHYNCYDATLFGCVSAHTRCAWVMEEFDEEKGVLVASSECGGSTTITLT